MARVTPIQDGSRTVEDGESVCRFASDGHDRNSITKRPSIGGSASKGADRSSIIRWRLRLLYHKLHWDESPLALKMRRLLHSRSFSIVTMVSLFVALFFSEIFTILQVPTNVELDLILTTVFFIFSCEFIGLILTDTSYLLSFFFFMDLIGTLSMIFDISFLDPLGSSDATIPTRVTTHGGQDQNFILVRASRAAKLGARAGRLSRVMKVLRFILPLLGFGEDTASQSQVKMAKIISNQLTNVLSTRVAFLTICIVCVLPALNMFAYPGTDFSMATWVDILNRNAEQYADARGRSAAVEQYWRLRLLESVQEFSDFYSDMGYGPFAVCYGKGVDHGDGQIVTCEPEVLQIGFTSKFSEPDRKSSIRELHMSRLKASYDMTEPEIQEAGANAGLIVFIIIVMISFGLVMSHSISQIALQPLERMLKVVRERCAQIFKYTDDLKEEEEENEGEEEEEYDTEQSSEFVLLERVVTKLAAIVNIYQQNEPEVQENLEALAWLQDGQAINNINSRKPEGSERQESKNENNGAPTSTFAEREEVTSAGESLVNDLISTISSEVMEQMEYAHFNSLSLTKELGIAVSVYLIVFSEGSAQWVKQNVKESALLKFVNICESQYPANPFHNFAHGVDVCWALAYYMRLIQAEKFLLESSMFWLLIAGLAHDLGHLGVSNQYLVESSHELAVKYNDRSPLENMHCSKMFHIVSDPEANIFAQMSKDLYKQVRQGMINAILHTDIMQHNQMIKELSMVYQLNQEKFESCDPAPALESQITLQLMMNALLHTADVNNPMKPWDMAFTLAQLCIDEFFAQGDQEKAKGMAVGMLNDREKVNRPNSQIGFIEFMIYPMVEAMVNCYPQLDELAVNLGFNIVRWSEVWIEQTQPALEALQKVQSRVAKVQRNCQGLCREAKGIHCAGGPYGSFRPE